MKLAVAIQHHPSRADLLPSLVDRLAPLSAAIVTDPDPAGKPSPWRCYRECLRAERRSDATHLLIVQDDAEPCVGFGVAVTRAIESRPDKPIAFFVSGALLDSAGAILRAGKARKRWVDLSPYSAAFPCVATSWPVALIPELLRFAEDKGFDEKTRADDGVLARFLQAKRIWPLATVPPLVQHPDLVPSLNGARAHAGRNQHRRACLDPPLDAALIDWET